MSRPALRFLIVAGVIGFALASFGCAPRRVYYQPGTVTYAAPPAQQVVVARPAAPYSGAVWVQGHWVWNGNQYVWQDGYYTQPRAGYVYVQPTWVRGSTGYVYQPGGWSRGGSVVYRTTPPRPPRAVVYGNRGGVVVSGPQRTVYSRPRAGVVVSSPQQTVYTGPRGGAVITGPRRTTVVAPGRPNRPNQRRGVVVRTNGPRRQGVVVVR